MLFLQSVLTNVELRSGKIVPYIQYVSFKMLMTKVCILCCREDGSFFAVKVSDSDIIAPEIHQVFNYEFVNCRFVVERVDKVQT